MDLGEDQIYAFRQSARTMGSSLIVVLEVVYKDVTRHQGHYFPMSIALIIFCVAADALSYYLRILSSLASVDANP
jgi:hypothetical protein